AYLGKRFGRSTQTTAGITFLFTRLLADGIRVLAAAIPLKVILDGLGVELSYFTITVILSVVTILYTLIGGLSAVVWLELVQLRLDRRGLVGRGPDAAVRRRRQHRDQRGRRHHRHRLAGRGRRGREDADLRVRRQPAQRRELLPRLPAGRRGVRDGLPRLRPARGPAPAGLPLQGRSAEGDHRLRSGRARAVRDLPGGGAGPVGLLPGHGSERSGPDTR